jgi:hypothetical protein
MFEAILAAFMPQQVEEREASKQEPLPAGISWCIGDNNERCACDMREKVKRMVCGYGGNVEYTEE